MYLDLAQTPIIYSALPIRVVLRYSLLPILKKN